MPDIRICSRTYCGTRMFRFVYQKDGVKHVYYVCPNCGRREDE